MKKIVIAALMLTACSQEANEELRDDPVLEGREVTVVEVEGGPEGLLADLEGPDAWRIDPGASSVMFTGRQGEDEFTGRFGTFDAQIRLDPDDPTGAMIVAAVDLGSVDAGSDDRNQSLPEAGWFDIARFPQATFRSSVVREVADGAYEADGALTIKGVSRDATMPFTLDIAGDGRAVADGQITLDRSDFGIGQGDFAGPEWVDTEVTVSVHVEAVPAG